METFVAHTPGTEKWAVFPTMLNPFEWEGIIQTDKEYIKVKVDAQDGVSGDGSRPPYLHLQSPGEEA